MSLPAMRARRSRPALPITASTTMKAAPTAASPASHSATPPPAASARNVPPTLPKTVGACRTASADAIGQEATMKHLRNIVMAVGLLAATLGASSAQAQSAVPVKARNVVLVHGAWADG